MTEGKKEMAREGWKVGAKESKHQTEAVRYFLPMQTMCAIEVVNFCEKIQKSTLRNGFTIDS